MSGDYVNAMLRRRLEEQNQLYYSNLYGGALQAQMMQQPMTASATAMTTGMNYGTYTNGLMGHLNSSQIFGNYPSPPLPETLTSIPQHPDLAWLDKRVNEMRWKL